MMKRLLNLHTIQKITLIFTTLLLLPNTAWGSKYIISSSDGSQVRTQSGSTSYSYGWQNSSIKWNIKQSGETGTVTGGVTTLQLSLDNGQSITLAASKPTNESGNFRIVTLTGLDQNLTATATFGSGNTLTRNGESFEPSTPIQWGSNDEIKITLTNNTSSTISCTISSITVLTGTQGSATFSWVNEATSPSGSNYDVSEIVKSVSGNDVVLSGKCEQNAIFSFCLYSSFGSHTIDYSSNNTNVAEVDNEGTVTVKSAGETTITAVPQGDDYNYYLPSSYRLVITDTYQFCDLIVGGHRVTTGNSNNILKDDQQTISFDGYQTLTLKGVNLNDGGIITDRQALTIRLSGTNTITVSDQDEACIKSTNGGAITIESNEGAGTENSLLLISGEGGSAISGVGSITLDSRLHAIPSYESSPSEWTNKAKEIFISNKQIYDIDIAGTQVTEGNLNNILNDDYKSVSYNPTTYTLTLKGVKIGDKNITIGEGISTLNIHLVGYNQISSIICKGSTTINITTSETLPGSLHFFNSIPETISLKNGLVRKDGEISTTKTNTIVSAFTGFVNYVADGSNSYIYSSQKEYYASNATMSGNMIVVSPKDGGTEAALWPSSQSDLESLKKVYLQFDWGTCTNKNVTVQIKGLSSDQGTTDGEVYSETIALSSADEDGIVEIPITSTITSKYFELAFTSNSTFSIVPLVIAMENLETYDLSIGETEVTEVNKSDVLGNGTIKYESETNTLILKNANIVTENGSDYPGIIYRGQDNLNIKLEGTNTMTNSIFRCFGSNDIMPNLNFIIDTDNPGTLTMTNGVRQSLSPDFSDVEEYFIEGFNLKYENATYNYNYEPNPNQAETYIGTYKISILKPSIWTSIEDKRYLIAENPMAETNPGTIKYSVVYADGTQGISDQTYSDPNPLKGPATVTSYIAYPNGKKSGTATGYYFGVSPKTQKLVYGTEAPTLNLQLTPQVESVHINDYLVYSYFASTTDRNVTIKGVGSTLGFAYLNTDPNVSYTNLGDSIGFVLEVVPASPTFSVDEGTYNQTQKVTLVSPYNDPNNIASELQTGESADISIKYYLGETKPEEPLTYSGPISISESTKLTAWVEVKYDLLNFSPDQSGSGGSGVTTEIYESEAVTKSYVINRDIANTTVILANDKTEFTYNEAANVPTITQVYLTEGTETPATTIELTANDYTLSYVQVNGETEEAIEADKIINAGSYKMILTGNGNFSGTKTVAFTINPRPIETPIITLSATEFVYNTQAQKPTVTVQFKESADVTKTIPTTDYDVTYSGDCINVDSYTVNVTLKGNYTGEADATFSITAGTMTVTAAGYEGTYDNQAHGITVSAPEGATVKYGSLKGTYNLTESPKYTDAGTYKVHYQVTMDNYTNVTDSAMVEISKADITPEVTLEGWTYGTTANLPSVTGNSGNGAVTYTYKAEGSETFTETMPEVVGTHTIKASIAETTNYNAGEATSTYTITAATTSVTAKGYKGAYDNQPHGVSITAPEGATVKYGTEKGTYNLDESPTYTDAGTYMVHYQVTMDNYTTVTDSATIEISKADITPTVTLEGWIFGTTANTPSVTGNTGNGAVTYTYKAEGTDTFVEAMPEVVGTHTIKASIAETTNYNAGEATATFAITASTMTVTANGYEGTYDGKAHGITVTAPEGATVMYGTQKDTYNLTESPTYTNAGTYKVHYQVTMDNHTTVADSATVKISKAEAELEFDVPEEGKIYATIGKEFTEPTLSNLHELSVTYGSSDESVATVDETTGKVTLISAGLTYITATFAGNNNYNELEVKYELRVKGTYNLWINNVQVTSDNYNDILENQKFFYDLVNKWLIITDNETPVTVKSSMPELTIYLNGKSELERIYFDNQGNAQNTGTLSFITYSDLPGKLILDTNNDNGVISGFSSISFDEKTNLRIIEPDSCEYKDGLVKMTRKDQLGDIVKIATIGQYIEPMVNGDGIDFDKDIDGNTNITNITIDDKLLITAMQHEEDTNEDDDYYDPSSGAIVLNTTNTSEDVEVLSQEVESGNKTPGSGDYADSFRGGITFMVPSGKGTIELEVMTGEGYMLMLKIGTGEPHEIIENERATVTIEYDVEESTYVYLYLQEKPVMKARWAGNVTRVGKRDTAHGRIYAVKVKASVVKSSNPLNSVEGAKGNVTIPTVNTVSPSNDDDVPTKAEFEITNDENNVNDDKWFTIDGRRIDKPTQKGLYIRNRKKIVVK